MSCEGACQDGGGWRDHSGGINYHVTTVSIWSQYCFIIKTARQYSLSVCLLVTGILLVGVKPITSHTGSVSMKMWRKYLGSQGRFWFFFQQQFFIEGHIKKKKKRHLWNLVPGGSGAAPGFFLLPRYRGISCPLAWAKCLNTPLVCK